MAGSEGKQNETILMLIGKTGNGKSATANTIFGSKRFKSTANSSSATKSIGHDVVTFEGRLIRVIDTPGFADTHCTEEQGLTLVTSQIEKVLVLCPDGIHACLIVLKYGVRFTSDEKNTIKHIKEIFGDKFLKKHCIILVTNGGDFFDDYPDSSIERWVEEEDQNEEFKDLYSECNKKIIAFDNKKKGKERLDQIRLLLQKVDTLGGRIYTDQHFEKAKKNREKMILTSKFPFIKDKTMTEVSLILQELNKIYQMKTKQVNFAELISLKSRAEKLLTDNIDEDKGTGVLNELNDTVKSLVANISEEIRVRERVKDEIQENESNKQNGSSSRDLETFLLLKDLENRRLVDTMQQQFLNMILLNDRTLQGKSGCIMM